MNVRIISDQINQSNEIDVNTVFLAEYVVSRLEQENDINSVKNLVNHANFDNVTPIMLAVIADRIDLLKLFYRFARLELRKEVFKSKRILSFNKIFFS